MVRVGQLSTYTFGGAATAARRLHDGLLRIGVDSRFWHRDDAENSVDDSRFAPLPLLPESSGGLLEPLRSQWDRLGRRQARVDWRRHLEERPGGFEVFSQPQLARPTRVDVAALQADLLHLHWVAFLFDHPTFFASLPKRLPLVWTLHDQAPFTGGCHYASGCDRFQTHCGNCPQVAAPQDQDVSRHGFEVRRRALRGRRLQVVTPSHWLNRSARLSDIWPAATEFSVIPYRLDLQRYRPVDPRPIRQEFGIDQTDFVIVFGAEDVANRRKGMPHLARALERLEPQVGWHALVFGDGELPRLPDWIRVHRLGYVRDEERKVHCLSAGDVFMLPSLEDNQPQTGLEALACATPVVAFAAGGIPEYVRDAETGWLAAVGEVDPLAQRLLSAASDRERRQELGRRGRQLMEREFPLELQATRMTRLYESLLGQATSRKSA